MVSGQGPKLLGVGWERLWMERRQVGLQILGGGMESGPNGEWAEAPKILEVGWKWLRW